MKRRMSENLKKGW